MLRYVLPGLSEDESQRVIGIITTGCLQKSVAQEFKVHPSTIC